MAEEIVQLKATFVADQTLAELRNIGREIGMLPSRAGQSIKKVHVEMTVLQQTVKGLGQAVTSALPALAALARGPAGIATAVVLATAAIGKSITDVGKNLVSLRHTARELGLTTQQLRGLQTAGERAAIAPEAMTEALKNFKRNTEDFKLRIGSLRTEMLNMLGGAGGELIDKIVNAKDEMEALQHAFDFSEAMEKAGRPEIGRKVMQMLTGNAQLARLTMKEIREDIAAEPFISDKAMDDAKRYNDIIISVGRAWDWLKQKLVLGLFDFATSGTAPAEAAPEAGPDTGLSDTGIPHFQSGGMMGQSGLAFLHAGEKVSPAGGDILEGSDDTLIKTTREGTFQGLLQYAALQEAAGGGMRGLGGLPGFGGGGGSLTGGAPAGGQVPGAEVAAAQAPQAAAGGGLPAGMPQVPGVPGAVPGSGVGPVTGLPQVPGVPGTTPGQMPAAPAVAPGAGPGVAPGGGGGQVGGDLSKLKGVDPRLADVTQAGASYLPPGYTIRPTSGHRPGDTGAHGRGLASDWQIYGPDGKPIPNRGADTSGLYRRWARGVYTEAIAKYGQGFADKLGYGGAFGTQKGGGGVADLMHMDLWGKRGRLDPSMILGSKSMQPFTEAERNAMKAPAARLDGANDAATQPPGGRVKADVTVTGDGTGSSKGAGGKDLFQAPSVRNHEQMAKTDDGPTGGIGAR